jgi:hypothetical protein
MRQQIEEYMLELPCNSCNGRRLKKEILGVTVGNKNIVEGTDMSIEEAEKFFAALVPSGKKEKERSGRVSPAFKGPDSALGFGVPATWPPHRPSVKSPVARATTRAAGARTFHSFN